MGSSLRRRLTDGHTLATTFVDLAEVERGLRPKERRGGGSLPSTGFLDRLRFLVTDRDGARRPVSIRQSGERGRAIGTPDALVAGTTRAQGAVLLTHNLDDFRCPTYRSSSPPTADAGRRLTVHFNRFVRDDVIRAKGRRAVPGTALDVGSDRG